MEIGHDLSCKSSFSVISDQAEGGTERSAERTGPSRFAALQGGVINPFALG
jgi:hypothetical protein